MPTASVKSVFLCCLILDIAKAWYWFNQCTLKTHPEIESILRLFLNVTGQNAKTKKRKACCPICLQPAHAHVHTHTHTHTHTQTYLSLYIFILSYHDDLPLTAVVIKHNTPTGLYVQNVHQVHVFFVSFQSPEVFQQSFLIILFVALEDNLIIVSLYIHFNYCVLTF